MSDRLCIRTASRLHFGLLGWGPEIVRQFGGIGLLIESPGMEVTLERADSWLAEGLLAPRVERLIARFAGGCSTLESRCRRCGSASNAPGRAHRPGRRHAALAGGCAASWSWLAVPALGPTSWRGSRAAAPVGDWSAWILPRWLDRGWGPQVRGGRSSAAGSRGFSRRLAGPCCAARRPWRPARIRREPGIRQAAADLASHRRCSLSPRFP